MFQEDYNRFLRKELSDDEFSRLESDLIWSDEEYRLHEYNPHPVQSLAYKVFDILTLGSRSKSNYIVEDTERETYLMLSREFGDRNFMEGSIESLLEPERS